MGQRSVPAAGLSLGTGASWPGDPRVGWDRPQPHTGSSPDTCSLFPASDPLVTGCVSAPVSLPVGSRSNDNLSGPSHMSVTGWGARGARIGPTARIGATFRRTCWLTGESEQLFQSLPG